MLFLSRIPLVKPDWVRANIGRALELKGWSLAVVGGILSVGPIYTWYALLRNLKKQRHENCTHRRISIQPQNQAAPGAIDDPLL